MPGSRPDQKSSAACQQAIQENPDSATHIDVYRIRLNWSIFLSLTRGEIGGRSGGGRLDDINSAFKMFPYIETERWHFRPFPLLLAMAMAAGYLIGSRRAERAGV